MMAENFPNLAKNKTTESSSANPEQNNLKEIYTQTHCNLMFKKKDKEKLLIVIREK